MAKDRWGFEGYFITEVVSEALVSNAKPDPAWRSGLAFLLDLVSFAI
jgi:hypothetical protein